MRRPASSGAAPGPTPASPRRAPARAGPGDCCFVCDHGKNRNAKRYNLGVTFVAPLPVPKVMQNRTV